MIVTPLAPACSLVTPLNTPEDTLERGDKADPVAGVSVFAVALPPEFSEIVNAVAVFDTT